MSLRRALALSIALHAIVLGIARPQQPLMHKAHQAPLIARLVEARLEPVPVQTTPAPTPSPVLRKPAPRRQPAAIAQRSASSAEPMPGEQPQVLEQAAIIERSIAPTFDAGAIAKYRLEIISAAKQFRRYPPIARENGWQGRAEVRVSFGGADEPALAISRSSGYAVLDRQAVETLTSALPALPPPLLGRSFELDFPVVFSLEE